MLKHNSYFNGGVQSLGFERHGRRQTMGVIDTGEFHFSTDSPERMTVVTGELAVRFDGSPEWRVYPAGTAFEVPGKSGFDVKASQPTGYLCEFL
ncbi:pyrimidine/purine nucleoside phosphorylase [Sorangium sp. So ce854]|uniref:pyrimidine/purine nucleoside phosphorylase n=1 Tax=Sorangium sp. So ce854 TaxID=3133322 RepID=UPI003F5F0F19